VLSNNLTLKHGTGNLRCPLGVDIDGRTGYAYDVQVTWDSEAFAYVWTVTPVGEPRWHGVPASASAPGRAGDMAYDASYTYVCVATDTWRRYPHSSW
jgi:hypothetical protein